MCSYYNVIHDAFTYNMGVVILHAPSGNNIPLKWLQLDRSVCPFCRNLSKFNFYTVENFPKIDHFIVDFRS